MARGTHRTDTCSFCGRPADSETRLIAGPEVNICSNCVGVCNEMLTKGKGQPAAPSAALSIGSIPRPHEIKEYLDHYVVGQERSKKVLSVAVHNHYKRINQSGDFAAAGEFKDVEIEKSNILLIGPTGCGKTLLARTLAKCLKVPFSISDATTLTEAGYVGEDVENILLRLIQAADGDVGKAELGIIYIDEIDKIAKRTDNVSITRDVSGEGVQQGLLKILEGVIANVPPHGGRKHPEQNYIKVNTERILFICGGAFVGLDEIVKRRKGKHVIGFDGAGTNVKVNEWAALPVEPEDLLKYGMIPEFVGRLPVVSALEGLSESDLVRILVEPRNSMVRQYQKLMAMNGVKLTFTDGAMKAMAKAAMKKKTGARGLRSILEEIMLDVMYEAPMHAHVKSIEVTKTMVERHKAHLVHDIPLSRSA